ELGRPLNVDVEDHADALRPVWLDLRPRCPVIVPAEYGGVFQELALRNRRLKPVAGPEVVVDAVHFPAPRLSGGRRNRMPQPWRKHLDGARDQGRFPTPGRAGHDDQGTYNHFDPRRPKVRENKTSRGA